MYDGHDSNRCLEIEKKIQLPIGTGSNPFVDQHKQMVLAPVKFVQMNEEPSPLDSISPEDLRRMGANTISESIGLEILEVQHGRVVGRLPVDERTHQPYGLLHGGASVVLAETLGSVGSHFIAAPRGKGAVGVEVNANHLRSVRSGWVTGTARLHHEGGRLHVWHIDIEDEEGRAVCTSRLTVMLVPKLEKPTP